MPSIWRLGGILLFASVAGCLQSPCDNEKINEVASPSGMKQVIIFSRDCGATVGSNTQVSIVGVGVSIPNGSGNTLILDGRVPLKLNWLSDSELAIRGVGPGKVYKQERNVDGVIVRYE